MGETGIENGKRERENKRNRKRLRNREIGRGRERKIEGERDMLFEDLFLRLTSQISLVLRCL